MIRKLSILIAVAACFLCNPTFASPLEVVEEPFTVTFSNSSCPSLGNVTAKITSAVYTDGTDYLYAYQIFDATGDFSWFSVGLQNSPVISETWIGSDGGFLTPIAWEASSAADSVDALFMPNKIGPGETSQWLWFRSDWAPGKGLAVLGNFSGTTTSYASGEVYIPMIPEPMTLTLLGAGVLVLWKRRVN